MELQESVALQVEPVVLGEREVLEEPAVPVGLESPELLVPREPQVLKVLGV